MALSNDKVSGNIELFERSSTKEFGGNDSKEFKESGFKEFEKSSTKEFKALNDWYRRNAEWRRNKKRTLARTRRRNAEWRRNKKRTLARTRRTRRNHQRRKTFEYGKSGNAIMDNFIMEKNLKWIPYDKFENIEYLDKGGFGTIYKANWFYNNEDNKVILKCHNNLSENLNEFLNEWEYHVSCLDSADIIYFYGFTKDPDTLKYMAVMDYANKGNLRGNLTIIIKGGWNKKLYMLFGIISGLNDIHRQNLIHCDFHDGNILNHNERKVYISDLGLCKSIRSFLKKYDIYGVIPFMAPEVLRGNSYTPASDIYSFSMIMWEFASGVPPFNNRAHDFQLSLSICEGERPEIIENTPQCYVDLMKKCWDENPLKRPSSEEVLNIIRDWIFLPSNVKVEDINEELKCNIMEFINAPIEYNNNLATESHPQAYYTSRLLDFTSKQLNETLKNRDLQAYYSSQSTSGKVNEESEDSQASVKLNEMLVNKDLDDCIVNLKSLDIKTDKK